MSNRPAAANRSLSPGLAGLCDDRAGLGEGGIEPVEIPSGRLQATSGKVMTAVAQGEAANKSPGVSPSDPDDIPLLPLQSQEDTDAAWGEHPTPDDDERFYRERPPHWDSI
jgi:hypothetical protein